MVGSKSSTLILLALVAAGVFKLSAFARESFIASRFGLTATTDAYFSLQQLPLALATFMFGAFGRAFTPAFADERRGAGRVDWLPGLMLYSIAIGCVLTVLTIVFSPVLLRLLTGSVQEGGQSTLAILSLCYLPIILIGFCAGIWTAHGRNLSSMTLTGLPYLLMTIALIFIYVMGALGSLSLPISMTAGFVSIGVVSLILILWRENPFHRVNELLRPWRLDGFRRFTSQLLASSIEASGYSLNQFLMLYFMARAGTGAISANNCATRIGMLGFSLLAQPLTQLMQARMCTSGEEIRAKLVQRYLMGMAAGTSALAVLLCIFRFQVAALVYMRGNFTATALEAVAAILPAWLTYFVVLSLNAVVSRYLFTKSTGSAYMRHMLGGYALTNVLRFASPASLGAPWIVWCSVIGDGCALLLNLRTCWIDHLIQSEEFGLVGGSA